MTRDYLDNERDREAEGADPLITSFFIKLAPYNPPEAMEHLLRRKLEEIGGSLLTLIGDGEWHSIKLTKHILPGHFTDMPDTVYHNYQLWIGRVKPVQLKWEPPPKLYGWKRIRAALRMLWHGEIVTEGTIVSTK